MIHQVSRSSHVLCPDRSDTGTRRRASAESQDVMGWQRQAESSELGDGGFLVRETIAKAFGLDAATRLPQLVSSGSKCGCSGGNMETPEIEDGQWLATDSPLVLPRLWRGL
jgi:hypothetical protein